MYKQTPPPWPVPYKVLKSCLKTETLGTNKVAMKKKYRMLTLILILIIIVIHHENLRFLVNYHHIL